MFTSPGQMSHGGGGGPKSAKKKSKKAKTTIEISDPTNFEHRVHTGYDALQGEFVDLPKQWAGVISPRSRRDPFIDPKLVTQVSLHILFSIAFTFRPKDIRIEM